MSEKEETLQRIEERLERVEVIILKDMQKDIYEFHIMLEKKLTVTRIVLLINTVATVIMAAIILAGR